MPVSYGRQHAAIYDAFYIVGLKRDYARQVRGLRLLMDYIRSSEGSRWFDFACGTGLDAQHLRRWYDVEGCDSSPHMLAVARRRCPELTFYEGDMTTIELGQEDYDVLSCRFGGIAHVLEIEQLHQTIARWSSFLKPGGALAIEPWLPPGAYHVGPSKTRIAQLGHMTVQREGHRRLEDGVAVIDHRFTVVRPSGTEQFREQLRLALYTSADIGSAIRAAGLHLRNYDFTFPMERGLIVGHKVA
jgi:dTDP-3-amino-3,6-dideoxy-alpha-D-glucopyranose N,N-dimethyltransferase